MALVDETSSGYLDDPGVRVASSTALLQELSRRLGGALLHAFDQLTLVPSIIPLFMAYLLYCPPSTLIAKASAFPRIECKYTDFST